MSRRLHFLCLLAPTLPLIAVAAFGSDPPPAAPAAQWALLIAVRKHADPR